MNHLITPYDEILTELEQIDRFLNITPSDEPEEIIMRGNELQAYMARTGKLLADAKYYYNDIVKLRIMEALSEIIANNKLSAKVQNALIEGIGVEQKYLVDWAERMNRACTHQLDWCRSRLSYEKEIYRQNMPVQ